MTATDRRRRRRCSTSSRSSRSVERPRLVVDLGSGTGLSTRVWADRAEEVVGIEPNARMAEQARLVTRAPNVRYVDSFAAETSLPAGAADIVTCSQAFHWMEPGAVLAEAARILRPGGVFAATTMTCRPSSTLTSTAPSSRTSRLDELPGRG